ncbi:MAG: 3-methyl-2-oxobutanoate hydroxymethyltransferase [Elusimicrobia bacterium]|nr:3-methyl-2-oxobutanoate hydroxymethyltransferase [Elusimicrobiota bacterium]
MKITPEALAARKSAKKKILLATAYSCREANFLDRAGRVDGLLVADAVGLVDLGYGNPLAVTLEEMLHHTKAVSRAKTRALVIADMPYLTYEFSPTEAARNAGRLLKEGGAGAVRVKGGLKILSSIEEILRTKVPVVAHLSYKKAAERQTPAEAKRLSEAGCFAVVLEDFPAPLVKEITRGVTAVTIATSSALHADGRLVFTEELINKKLKSLYQTLFL